MTAAKRALGDRGVRIAILALVAALLISLQPTPAAEAHTYSYCGHGYSGHHLANGYVWDVEYVGIVNWSSPHIHRTLHYNVFVNIIFGVIYQPVHYTTLVCWNHPL